MSGVRTATLSDRIRSERVTCPDHPMPFPKPSCWTCGRNGAFERAARIADEAGLTPQERAHINAVEDNLPVHYFDCERFNTTGYGLFQKKCDCTATDDLRKLLNLVAEELPHDE